MPIDRLHGAWRIEEAPCRNNEDHPYGFPSTHWLILGDRVAVVRERVPEPLHFDFRIDIDDSSHPSECNIGGQHGGVGYYEVDDDLLLIGVGLHGCRPPRFASDCGNFFAFTRDHAFELPALPDWPRADIFSESLGQLVWDPRQPEYLGDWKGLVDLPDGHQCEVWASDYLIPLAHYLPHVEMAYHWLQDHLPDVKAVCGERVREWIDEDAQYRRLTREQVAATISINTIVATDGDVYLWASTSIPIDHSIRVDLESEGQAIRASGVSIEG